MSSLRELLRGARVSDLGPLPTAELPSEATLQQALQSLVRSRRGAVVAVEAGKPLGIFTERDVLYRLTEAQRISRVARERVRLRDVMSKPAVTISRQASLEEAAAVMSKLRHRHLVVIDRDGGMRGLLNTNDLVEFLTDFFPEHVVNLPPHLHQQYRTSEGG